MNILEAPPLRVRTLEFLKQCGLPVIIYGAGVNGSNVCAFLEKQGIEVLAFIVSNGQPSPPRMIGNHPVLFRSELSSRNPFVLVLATGNFQFEKGLLAEGTASFPGCVGIERLALGPVVEMDYEFFYSFRDRFEQTCSWLEDDLSKRIMEAYLNARIGGDLTRLLELAGPEDYDFSLLRRSDREIYVDCGAYQGMGIDLFLSSAPEIAEPEIFAFEPDSQIAEKLKMKFSGQRNFHLIAKAAYSGSCLLNFVVDGYGNSHVSQDNGSSVEAAKIDAVLEGKRASIIKMDIEGSELEALHGAEIQLREAKPRMAVCVYHKPDDLITIPQYIKSVNPDYKFLLRHHNKKWISELVLYAI